MTKTEKTVRREAQAAGVEHPGGATWLRTIIDSAADYAFIVTDREGAVVLWSRGAQALLGWTESEAMGRSASLIFTPEDQAAGAPEAEMSLALEAGRASDERWHRRKDGSLFWASGELMPTRGEA